MKKLGLGVLFSILLAPAAVVAQTEKPFVLGRIDNIVKVFYVTGGCHHLLVFEENEYRSIDACSWPVSVGTKAGLKSYLLGLQCDAARIFPTSGPSYATAVKISETRVATRIYISNLDVFEGSSTQKRDGKHTYRTETVEVLK